MKPLDNRESLDRVALIIDLEPKLSQLLAARRANISLMEGYPSGINLAGSLQRAIRRDNLTELLTSIIEIRECVRCAVRVLDAYVSMDTKRVQFVRSEVLLEIRKVAQALGTVKISADTLDFIGDLIITGEIVPDSWELVGNSGSNSLHKEMLKLYEEALEGGDGSSLPIYSPVSETIATLGATSTRPGTRPKPGEKSDENRIVIHRYALARVVDHVYQLLMDTAIWNSFIPARTDASTSSNRERAKGLRTMGLYLQSLLAYPLFFGLESFLASYDIVKEWIHPFRPFDSETEFNLENEIRSKDYLNARADVKSLYDSFMTHDLDFISSHVYIFPKQYMAPFGMKASFEEIAKKAEEFDVTVSVSDLKVLRGPKYLPLLEGKSIAALNIATDVTALIIGKTLVDDVVRTSAASVSPAMKRMWTADAAEDLKRLNIACQLPFIIPNAYTWKPDKGVSVSIEGDRLNLDTAMAPFSYDYHKYVRENVSYTFFSDNVPSKNFAHYTPSFGVNKVIATELVEKLRIKPGQRTLIPSCMSDHSRTWCLDDLKGSLANTRMLIEQLTGSSIDVFRRVALAQFTRTQYATVFSSFALMYVDKLYADQNEARLGTWTVDEEFEAQKSVKPELMLVTGFGKPYGVSFSDLAQMQGEFVREKHALYVGSGLYLRFINKFPVPSKTIEVDLNILNNHFHPYFPGNGGTIATHKFVIGDALSNYALFPAYAKPAVPDLLLSDAFAYINRRLMTDLSAYYTQASPSVGREGYPMKRRIQNWRGEYTQLHMRHIDFGGYAAVTLPAVTEQEPVKVSDILKAAEEREKAMHAQTVADAEQKNTGDAVGEKIEKDIAAL